MSSSLISQHRPENLGFVLRGKPHLMLKLNNKLNETVGETDLHTQRASIQISTLVNMLIHEAWVLTVYQNETG